VLFTVAALIHAPPWVEWLAAPLVAVTIFGIGFLGVKKTLVFRRDVRGLREDLNSNPGD
jgi:hypothetical protein